MNVSALIMIAATVTVWVVQSTGPRRRDHRTGYLQGRPRTTRVGGPGGWGGLMLRVRLGG